MGGLGTKSIHGTAKAALLSQVSNVVSNKSTCWNLWVNAKYLRGESFWDVMIPKNASRGWKSILMLTPIAIPLIKFLVGNGHQIKFWTDPWLNGGRLKDCYGDRALYDLGMGADTKVHQFIQTDGWRFPTPTSNALMDIFQSIPNEIEPWPNFKDELVWTPKDHGNFTLKSAYNLVCRNWDQSLQWPSMIWVKWCITRHSICAWMLLGGRLKTKDLFILCWAIRRPSSFPPWLPRLVRPSSMDGGAASIQSDPSPSSLMDNIRSMLLYTDDRNAQISIIKSVLKRNQEHAIPLDLPRYLTIEAKVRLGKEKMSASSNRVAPNTADEESRKTQLVQVETADGSIPDANSLNNKVLQVEAAGGRILSNDGVAVMETPGSGENRSGLFIPKTLQLKDAAEIPSRADTWSSLFSPQVGRARALQRRHQPSNDPDHHIEFDEEDSSAAVQNWGKSLVGNFVGNTPSTPDIN